MVGVNSRLDSLQAAVLNVKLPHLDTYNELRRQAADRYDQLFSGHPDLSIPLRAQGTTHIFHQYTLLVAGNKRDGLLNHLQQQDIPCAVYYPVPLHLQKAYLDARYTHGDFPNAERVAEACISLPMHTELTAAQQEHIAGILIGYLDHH